MIKQDIIEEHPQDQPAPWVSNIILATKQDNGIRVTLDAREVNKAIIPTNAPISRQEDIKAKLAGCQVFSKINFKSAFWQIELDENSRYLTVFHTNEKLYRHKRLTMGLKPAQGELNATLPPIFANIPNTHLIHDDLIIANQTVDEYLTTLKDVMNVISKSGLTLNPSKCTFGKNEINFWGMIYGQGVRPDPAKVQALDYITPRQIEEELISFLCMMQLNSDFIPNFAKESGTLRELAKKNAHFKWVNEHQKCFECLIKYFCKDTLI